MTNDSESGASSFPRKWRGVNQNHRIGADGKEIERKKNCMVVLTLL